MEAKNMNVGDVGAADIRSELKTGFWGPYDHSFGPLTDGTVYYGGRRDAGRERAEGKALSLRDNFMREKLAEGRNRLRTQLKATTSTLGGTGTTDYVMSPVYLMPEIVMIDREFTPFVAMIPRRTNRGRTAEYNRITTLASAVAYSEDGALSDVQDTPERESIPIKNLASVGRITGKARATIPPMMVAGMSPTGSGVSPGSTFQDTGMMSPMAQEVQKRAIALKRFEEELIWNGSISSDSNEFDGIVQLQGSTNRTVLSDSIGLDNIETAVENAAAPGDSGGEQGMPDMAGCSYGVLKDIRNLLRDSYRYGPRDLVGTTGLPFGMSPQLIYDSAVGPIPIIPSGRLDNDSGSKSIYFLDSNFVEMRVLQDMTYETLAHTNDSDKFFLKIYEALILRAPEFNSCITSIT